MPNDEEVFEARYFGGFEARAKWGWMLWSHAVNRNPDVVESMEDARGEDVDVFSPEYASYRKMQSEELFEVLAELQEDAAEYPTFDAWFTHMEEYAEQLKRQKAKENIDFFRHTTDSFTSG